MTKVGEGRTKGRVHAHTDHCWDHWARFASAAASTTETTRLLYRFLADVVIVIDCARQVPLSVGEACRKRKAFRWTSFSSPIRTSQTGPKKTMILALKVSLTCQSLDAFPSLLLPPGHLDRLHCLHIFPGPRFIKFAQRQRSARHSTSADSTTASNGRAFTRAFEDTP